MTWHTIKTNCIKLKAIDPEICLILTFKRRVCLYDFQGKCFLFYILSTDQISLSDCLYFWWHWAIRVLQLFVSQVITSKLNLIFLIKSFFYMTKKSRQKFKYLENKNIFSGEIKSIFHNFQMAFSFQKLAETWEFTFKSFKVVTIRVMSLQDF